MVWKNQKKTRRKHQTNLNIWDGSGMVRGFFGDLFRVFSEGFRGFSKKKTKMSKPRPRNLAFPSRIQKKKKNKRSQADAPSPSADARCGHLSLRSLFFSICWGNFGKFRKKDFCWKSLGNVGKSRTSFGNLWICWGARSPVQPPNKNIEFILKNIVFLRKINKNQNLERNGCDKHH